MAVSSSFHVEKRAYEIYRKQKQRAGVTYSREDFVCWYLKNYFRKNWKRPHVARFDHDAPYSFSNIEMQEQSENNKERNARRGNPGKTHRPVLAFVGRKSMRFDSQAQAAAHFRMNVKTVYNRCQGRTKHPGRFGPKTDKVIFKWA